MSKFNLSESEKNRILGLHKTKKENVILQEQINYRGKGYTFDSVPGWAMENPCFSVLQNESGFNIYCKREPNMGEPIDGRTGGIQTAVYLGISPQECCPSLNPNNKPGKRNQVFREELPEWGYDCVMFRKVNYSGVGPVTIARCKFGTANLPIGFETVGDFISIEDCCKLGNIEIIDDVDGGGEKPQPSGKCARFKQEHSDIPTEGRRETYLRKCIKGDKVKMVQDKLNELGIDVVGRSDSFFGDKTKKGVMEYQEKFDLQVDGVVGPETWNHMFSEAVEGIEDDVVDIMTDDEANSAIEEIKGDRPDKKTCRRLIKATSYKIKGGVEVEEMKNDQDLVKTLGYCFNRHDFPLIAGHGRRVRRELGLKKKNNQI